MDPDLTRQPYPRTNYHTSLFSQKTSKTKLRRLDNTTAADDVVELGRYERNEQGEWVRNVVQRKKSSAVLSPELAADIEEVLEQDIEGLVDTAPVTKQSRDQSAAVKRVKEAKTKKKSKTQPSKSDTGKGRTNKDDKAVLAQYADLVDKSDFKPEKPREIRAPTESHEETEHTVTQVVEWLKHEKMSDLCVIDLRNKTDWARFMVVATAMSERHNRAAAEFIAHKLGQLRGKSYTVHTGGEDNWLIVFTGDMVVELFTEERRKFYDIERLWVLRRPIEEEMDIDPDDLVRFQFDEEDGMYDDEVRAKIAAERRARGEVVEEPVIVREADDVTPVIPYSSRDKADKKSKKKRK